MASKVAPLDMTRRRFFWLICLAATLVVCCFSYWWPSHAVAPTRIVIERDSTDRVGSGRSQTKTGYEPYYDRVNLVSPDLTGAGASNTPNTRH